MKLAEALAERSDCQNKIEHKGRLFRNRPRAGRRAANGGFR